MGGILEGDQHRLYVPAAIRMTRNIVFNYEYDYFY